MPSVSKSKTGSNNRMSSVAAAKEQLKDVVKPAISISSAAEPETPTVETVPQLENEVHSNLISRNVDDLGTTGSMDDSVSNNGSCYSIESEDTKEKTFSHIIDVDKREKIRLRNEKKHQRQRERRALELHERCCSLLMSNKLESLSRQLVAMGFTSERANVALKMNEGKLEESVVWLIERNAEGNMKSTNPADERLLNIDITDELAQITAMEMRYGFTKKDMERAVILSEGDLLKTEEIVRRQKQEMSLSAKKSEETITNITAPPLEKPLALDSIQQLKGERDQYYSNLVATSSESTSKYQQIGSDGSWNPLLPSASVLARHSTNASPVDGRHSFTGFIANNIHQTGIMEPLVVTQLPHSSSTSHVSRSTTVAGSYKSLLSSRSGQLNQADYRHKDLAGSLSAPLNVPSSLGLFSTRTNLNSSSSNVEWSHIDWYGAGEMPICDYNSIDWTMDLNPVSKGNLQLENLGLSSKWKKRNEGLMAGRNVTVGSLYEWTTPFGDSDVLSASRQFVKSSTLW